MDLTDIKEHSNQQQQHTHSSQEYKEHFPRAVDHTLGHKTSLSKVKKTEIMAGIFSDYSGHNRNQQQKKTGKFMNT